ncbi:DDE-type integrase/transposase/recombinase [Streptomyces sp. NPDC005533]|uniref:DDE-type integrase/transposase/recombinase n=1 Tax=Streptomyces sp. NPDC005533 TaxID=3364723 RepID=UPI0036797280
MAGARCWLSSAEPAFPRPVSGPSTGTYAHSACWRHEGQQTQNNRLQPGRHPGGRLLNRDFTAPAPDPKWITDFTTYVRTYQSFTYVAFVVDCFSQKFVGWHAFVRRDVERVDVPIRTALWRRGREGHPRSAGTSSYVSPTPGRKIRACASPNICGSKA